MDAHILHDDRQTVTYAPAFRHILMATLCSSGTNSTTSSASASPTEERAHQALQQVVSALAPSLRDQEHLVRDLR
jgi:hypothetical protein